MTVISRKLFARTSIFHVHGVNLHSYRIWGTKDPRALMFATAAKSTYDGPISHESTITSAVYLDMLENFVFPQIVAEVNGLNFRQDGAPAHTDYSGWIGRGGPIIWIS
jgi:hypothetical protein